MWKQEKRKKEPSKKVIALNAGKRKQKIASGLRGCAIIVVNTSTDNLIAGEMKTRIK